MMANLGNLILEGPLVANLDSQLKIVPGGHLGQLYRKEPPGGQFRQIGMEVPPGGQFVQLCLKHRLVANLGNFLGLHPGGEFGPSYPGGAPGGQFRQLCL